MFKGRLCGYICAECPEPLANLQVRLYRVDKQPNVAALAVANPKETFAILDDDQVQEKASRLLAKVETDAEGNFAFELSKNYAGEAFEVDVYCGSVPRQRIGKTHPSRVSLPSQPCNHAIGKPRMGLLRFGTIACPIVSGVRFWRGLMCGRSVGVFWIARQNSPLWA